MKGYMYILKCSNEQFYIGSTKYLNKRITQHKAGQGAIFTRKYAPADLVYFEEHKHIGLAFNREHQVKKWNRKKKQALIDGNHKLLPELAMAYEKLHRMKNVGIELDFVFVKK